MTATPIPSPISLPQLRDFLRAHLVDDIMPFWTRHAIDPAGGINNCIRDNGEIVNRDRWLWSQWRAVWVFSRLYRTIEPRKEWLDAAWGIYRFATKYGWDEKTPGWRLALAGDGEVIQGCESIYVDAFAIYGLTELALVTRDAQVIAWARKTANAAIEKLKAPHDQIPHFPYPIPKGARQHGIPMMFALVLWDLGQALNEDRYRRAAVGFHDEIYEKFYRPGRDVLIERIAAGGGDYPAPDGTTVVPGHVIEDMWFQMHIALDRGDKARVTESIRLIKRHLELGWDPEYGGIIHAIEINGKPDVGWPAPEGKLWWPHTEAMYALLLAHKLCGEPWCMEWYWRVHNLSFEKFPLPEFGEWRQKFDRRFQPLNWFPIPVKDPFHLPRALILSVELLSKP